MNQVALRPAAGPIDLFAPAEVRGTVDNRLAQLANGLSEFSHGLGVFADAYLTDQKQTGYEQAVKEHQQRQLKSLDDLSAAVKAGQIRENSNPWKMVFLRQLVGRDQVRTNLMALEDEWTNPTAHDDTVQARMSHSVGAADAWASQRIATFTTGMDPHTAAAVSDVVDKWKGQFLSTQQDQWEKQRSYVSDVAASNEMVNSLAPAVETFRNYASQGPPSPEDTALIDNAFGQVNRTVANAMKVYADPEKVTKLAAHALANVATTAGSSEVFEQGLNKVKIGDKLLKDALPPGTVTQVENEISAARRRKYEEARFEEQAQDQKNLETFQDWMSKQPRVDTQGRPVDPAILLENLPEFQALKERSRYYIRKEIRDESAADTEKWFGGVLGKYGPQGNETHTALQYLIANSLPGWERANAMVETWGRDSERGDWAHHTDPEIVKNMVSAFTGTMSNGDPTTSAAVLADVENARKAGKITEADYRTWYNNGSRWGLWEQHDVVNHVNGWMQYVELKIREDMKLDPRFSFVMQRAEMTGQPFELPSEAKMQATLAAKRLQETTANFMLQHPTGVTQDQLDAALKPVVDDIVTKNTKYGHLTPEQTRARQNALLAVGTGDLETAVANKDVQYVPSSKQWMLVGPDGKLSEPVQIPSMFKSFKELEAGVEQKAAGLKLDSDGTADFIAHQITSLPPAEARKAGEWWTLKTMGPDAVQQAKEGAAMSRHLVETIQISRQEQQKAVSSNSKYWGWYPAKGQFNAESLHTPTPAEIQNAGQWEDYAVQLYDQLSKNPNSQTPAALAKLKQLTELIGNQQGAFLPFDVPPPK